MLNVIVRSVCVVLCCVVLCCVVLITAVVRYQVPSEDLDGMSQVVKSMVISYLLSQSATS